jgi:hypothetical protein
VQYNIRERVAERRRALLDKELNLFVGQSEQFSRLLAARKDGPGGGGGGSRETSVEWGGVRQGSAERGGVGGGVARGENAGKREAVEEAGGERNGAGRAMGTAWKVEEFASGKSEGADVEAVQKPGAATRGKGKAHFKEGSRGKGEDTSLGEEGTVEGVEVGMGQGVGDSESDDEDVGGAEGMESRSEKESRASSDSDAGLDGEEEIDDEETLAAEEALAWEEGTARSGAAEASMLLPVS